MELTESEDVSLTNVVQLMFYISSINERFTKQLTRYTGGRWCVLFIPIYIYVYDNIKLYCMGFKDARNRWNNWEKYYFIVYEDKHHMFFKHPPFRNPNIVELKAELKNSIINYKLSVLGDLK
jgi:hypothetical protein